jgi:3-methyl-2-oxobutanoate hydroxymethyltransferase
MLGLNPNPPKFVKQYGNLLQGIEDAVEGYAKDVKARAFPTKDQTYQIKK